VDLGLGFLVSKCGLRVRVCSAKVWTLQTFVASKCGHYKLFQSQNADTTNFCNEKSVLYTPWDVPYGMGGGLYSPPGIPPGIWLESWNSTGLISEFDIPVESAWNIMGIVFLLYVL